MERCTDNRSSTPPLTEKMIELSTKESEKQIALALLLNEDKIEKCRSTPTSTIANNTIGLCNYNSTSDDEIAPETQLKSVSDRGEGSKTATVNKQKSNERDRRNRRHAPSSRDRSSRRKSTDRDRDRKHRRSTSNHLKKHNQPKRWRSRSKEKLSPKFHDFKDAPKELPKDREIRRTTSEPVIEYCENGKYTNTNTNTSIYMEPKQKVRRIIEPDGYDVLQIYYGEVQNAAKDTASQCSNISNRSEIGRVGNETSLRKMQKSRDDCSKLTPTIEERKETKEKLIESENLSNCNKINSSSEPVNTEQSPHQHNVNKFESKSLITFSPSNNSDNLDTTPPPPENVKSPIKLKDKVEESKVLSEDKMKQYIDEYDSFIQQVSSPINDPLSSIVLKTISESHPIDVSNLILCRDLLNDKNFLKIGLSSTPSPTKNLDKVDRQSSSSSGSDNDSSSSTSSSSSSSSDDDSSSTCSSSSSSSDNENTDDENHRGKSNSRSGSSRSTSRSPRIRLSKLIKHDESKMVHTDLDGFDFAVDGDKASTNEMEPAMNSPIALLKEKMNFSANTFKTLDELMNFEDDDDLFRNIETYKNDMREKKMAKEAAEKSKIDAVLSNDEIKKLENGALLHESERKKISLKLKPTVTIKQQAKEVTESCVDAENQNLQQPIKSNNKEQANEQTDQVENSSTAVKSVTSKKKDSYRKDDRKSRFSEDRKNRHSEERGRSRRSEDRRGGRTEEKRLKRNEENRLKRSEDRHSRRSEERRSRRSEEKRQRRSEERRTKRRHDRSPISPVHYRDSYYSPTYRNRSMSPLPRGPRTPPNTPPPNQNEFDDFQGDDMAMRHMQYGNAVMPPPAHYQPGPIQFSAPNLPNVSSYMNEYAAYMHPNRMSVPQYNRPLPGVNTQIGIIPILGSNNEYYYHNASSHLSSHLASQQIPPKPYSNLIEVPQYGVLNSLNVDCVRKQADGRRKPTIAVQKGNVLEIVPSAEIHCDKNIDAANAEKSEKMHLMEKQQQQTLQRQKQERMKRKVERHQKRLERSKRKEFLIIELNRLSHLMMFGDDGKTIKAGEILKSLIFDGSNLKIPNSKELDDDDEMEEIYMEPAIYTYDPQAIVGKGILLERNDTEKIPSAKDSNVPKRRSVLFADGIAPGDGTSASENSENEDDNLIKPKKLSARGKQRQNTKDMAMPPFANETTSLFLEKENSLETRTISRNAEEQQIVPPPPPGSPPLHLPQPKLKDPDKFIINQLLYFHYDLRLNEMIVTPHIPMMNAMIIPPVAHSLPPVQPAPAQTYMFKSNSVRHHGDSKVSKSKSSSSNNYHSSHKSIHASNETNLIVLSSSPSNV